MTALHAPRPVRIGLAVITAAALVSSLTLFSAGTASAGNPSLAKNSHGHLANGKSLPHVSGGTEVAFDQERAEAADAASGTAAGSDLPPDATASAVGCANRGSLTNPRVNQDCTARRQAEEQIAINPSDPTNIVAGQNDSRIGFNHCGFDYSLDSGKTWGDGIPPYSQHLSPVGHVYDAASDPTVTFAGTPSTAWYSCIVFDINSNASGLFASPSTVGLKGSAYANIGAGASRFVVAETADGHTFYDKQFMSGGPDGSVYVTFTRFLSDQKCSKGNNPGAYCSSEIFLSKWDPQAKFGAEAVAGGAWSTPISISGASPLCTGGNSFDKKADPSACNFNQGSMPVVLADGSVFVVFNNGNTPTLLNQQLGRTVSAAGLPTGSVIKVGRDDETKLGLCDFGRGAEECVLGLRVRTNDFPAISTDPHNGGHLVAVWQDSRGSDGTHGNYNLVVSDSTDAGLTWSDANGGGTVIAEGTDSLSQPSVTVTQRGRTVVSAYRATAKVKNPGDGTFGYGLYVRPLDGTFGNYEDVSDSQVLPGPDGNAAQAGFLGDYSSIDSVGETVYPLWADTRNSSSVGPDEDVFVAAVTLG